MKFKGTILWTCGILSVLMIAAGLGSVLLSESFSDVVGIIMCCLSLATGIIIPNPISFISLVVGVLLILVSGQITGGIILGIGIICSAMTLIAGQKSKA